jgi:pantoate--beta-alanine ligase
MRLIEDPFEFQRECQRVRAGGGRLGLVPTMGALHQGHLSLVSAARERSDYVALTLFVNPIQFASNEGLSRYPRNLDGDLALCRDHGVDAVFAPAAAAMYLPGDATRVLVSRLSQGLCGASRPDHFAGVCTVVSKLFLLAGSCTAVFGRKDYQQLRIIERMARDLFFPVVVLGAPIVREPSGLALSSRNLRLGPAEREAALGLVRGLSRAQRLHLAGERAVAVLRDAALSSLQSHGLRADYVTLADADDLAEFEETVPQRALLALAAFAGDVRLIDNVVLGEDPALT